MNDLRIFAFTFIEAIQPTSATMLHSMWYALRSKVSECVTWLAMISIKKKAVVKNSTRYSCTGCSLLNHSFTAMTLLAKSVVNVSTLYDDISRQYMKNHCIIFHDRTISLYNDRMFCIIYNCVRSRKFIYRICFRNL